LVFKHACVLELEGIVSKRLDSKNRSGRTKSWIKVKNPDAPAARRVIE
jgi:bifunctional non-homologous end joining protein LigD